MILINSFTSSHDNLYAFTNTQQNPILPAACQILHTFIRSNIPCQILVNNAWFFPPYWFTVTVHARTRDNQYNLAITTRNIMSY